MTQEERPVSINVCVRSVDRELWDKLRIEGRAA